MRTIKLTSEGLCNKCGTWIELGECGGLLKHPGTGKDSEECPNTGYSTLKGRYRINTEAQAHRVAKFFVNDTGGCLVRDHHSLACGDGDGCAAERLQLAKALAGYLLKDQCLP